MNIVEGLLDNEQVQSLLHAHLTGMHDNSPPGSVFALDLSGLQAREVTFYTAWRGNALLGMGALKEIDGNSGELKSMRTDAAHLRKGVGAALLEHIIEVATQRGYRRLSLETGSGEAFEAALLLYRRYGFRNGDAFGDYAQSEFCQFLHLDL